MSATDLRQQVEIELERMSRTLGEIASLQADLKGREPTQREKTAAGAFLCQLYTGVENILLRICKHRGVDLPTGEDWHLELVTKFCDPPQPGLPMLLDKKLELALDAYRRFRHFFAHTYGILLEWDRMGDGVIGAQAVFSEFAARVREYLTTL